MLPVITITSAVLAAGSLRSQASPSPSGSVRSTRNTSGVPAARLSRASASEPARARDEALALHEQLEAHPEVLVVVDDQGMESAHFDSPLQEATSFMSSQ